MTDAFTYKPFYRFVYRYGNLLMTPILLIYMLPAVTAFSYKSSQILYLLALSLIIFFVNKLYFRLYRILPFLIEVDEEKIICSQFIKKDKKEIVYFSEIVKLKGGIFHGKSKGLMQIDGKNISIGFFHHLTDANIFITKLLQNVPAAVYKIIEPQIKSRLEN